MSLGKTLGKMLRKSRGCPWEKHCENPGMSLGEKLGKTL